jgi:hypothetical protein
LKTLLAALLTFSVAAAAQESSGKKPERGSARPSSGAGPDGARREPPAGLGQAGPAGAEKAPPAPGAPAPSAGFPALAFLVWATGDKGQPGAYEAPALCCRLARDISNGAVGPVLVSVRGVQLSVDFVRSLLAAGGVCGGGRATPPGGGGRAVTQYDACAEGEPLGLPAAEVLPVAKKEVRAWLAKTNATAALSAYFDAAQTRDPHATLKDAREDFFEVGFAEAAKDAAAMAAFCAEIEPGSAACPGELTQLIAQKKFGDLHRRARAGRAK